MITSKIHKVMKSLLHLSLHATKSLMVALLLFASQVQAQKQSIGVLNIEGRGVLPTAEALGSMVRIEMEKTNRYTVLDWYDIREVLVKNNVDVTSCYGKTCVMDAGKILRADKMLVGSVERFGERIAIILKVVDVQTGEIVSSNTTEYQNFQTEMQRMIEISVKSLLGITPDPKLVEALVSYNEPVESHVTKVNLSGPRVGMYYTDGIAGERMRADKVPYGGLGMYAVSSMIGWQQEVQYLSSGNFQCLFEFLFTGSGLESGRFIPAFTFLNGFRMNKQGWEIAFGPTFRVVRKADGYYTVDDNGNFDAVKDWHLKDDWDESQGPNPYPIISNLDDRGDPSVSAGLVIGVGKTFTSGSLNIPVNVYCIPRKEGTVYGMSVGFNVFKSQKK
jgi:hypothetical protein